MSIPDVASLDHYDQPDVGYTNMTSQSSQGNGNLKIIKLNGLAAHQHSTLTGMKDEILLLSWFLVLLRVKDDRQVEYDWVYQTRGPGAEREISGGCLSTDNVMVSLESNAGQAATAILQHVTNTTLGSYEASAGPISLLMSTTRRFKKSQDNKHEVDRYSTFLACLLKEKGVKFDDYLPICFEKSKWTIIAVLSVMKAGGTMVLMDPALPLARLQNIAKQVNAKTIIVSRSQYNLSASILPNGNIVILGEDTFTDISDLQFLPHLRAVPSSTMMYIIFTSGSTGTPKGVQISHQSYSSSAFPRAKAVGYTKDSRVLDFASYAFDVSIDSMLLTLANGGCLCIPSDEERLNDLNTAMRRMKVNYAGLTPSVARILDLDVIKSLDGLGLGGEAASLSDVARWGQYTRIIIGYGPCECTIGCTVNSNAATNRDYITIGPGNGSVIWITDPDDCGSLMPVGAVGELLVEGPIVGQGYLNDPDKTAAAFIQDPSWLVAGYGRHAGRRGRLYKTGDLGMYAPDSSGEIIFVGRKDTQIKLRGQRVELGEIESQLKARLPTDIKVTAEVITPSGPGSQPTLVAFIANQAGKVDENRELGSVQLLDELREMLLRADAEATKVLPRYMIPVAYITINYMPILISGKIDRKRLREFGSVVDLQQLDKSTRKTITRPLSGLEQRLRKAWASVLNQDPEEIGLADNFFALGGNSLAAMKLVSDCRGRGLELSVAGTFSNPTLSEMASVVIFIDSARFEASCACGTNQELIEDIYPCTPTQESLFTFSLKSNKPYVAQRIACIPSGISLDSWRHAWEHVVAANPILRTRLAQLQDPGLQQVVLNESISWKYSTDLLQYLEIDKIEKMNLGQSLARYAIIDQQDDGRRYMVWTVHHVLYDGWSEPIILKKIRERLRNFETELQEPVQTNMREFVKYVRDTDHTAMQDFWRRELEYAVGSQFPRLPSRDFLPNPDYMVEHQISLDTNFGFPFTLATVIRGAWALVASQYTQNDDVVFGETFTGRDIPLPGVESVIGPLIATVPIRIRIDRTNSVEDYLKAVQRVILHRTPYQHMGMQNIRKVSQDAQHACEAGTGLVIQPEPEYDGTDIGFHQGDAVREALHFNPYPLMLACGIRQGGFRVCASFDRSVIEVAQMKRILSQLEAACLQLTKDVYRRIGEISCLPEAELNQIWSFNHAPPLSFDETSRKFRAGGETKPGSIYPQFLVPWVCNPRNPALLSPIGSPGELWLEGHSLPSSSTTESPAWLLDGTTEFIGRTGKLQSTGDLVQLQEDGKLIFVGRLENIVPVNGHSMDLRDFEAHLTQILYPSTRYAAAIRQPIIVNTQQPFNQELILFIEQQPLEKANVNLMLADCKISYESSDTQTFNTSICATISASLAGTLKKLDKFIRNSLPSHMIPFTYVTIDKTFFEMGQTNHSLRNKLASEIPQYVLAQLRENLEKEWRKKNPIQLNFTAAENILRSAWEKVLGINKDHIDVDDNFFRLGGDSVLAMKLTSNLRKQGHALSVADVFQHMCLGDAAKVLRVDGMFKGEAELYAPFSMLGSIDVELFLSEFIRPKLACPGSNIKDVFMTTDSQRLDVRATIQRPRTSMQYTMLYFDEDAINEAQLLQACSNLVKTHDILRTVFVEYDSTLFQVVLGGIDVPNERLQISALNYWENLLRGSTLSILPGKSMKLEDKAIFRTKQVEILNLPEGITTASLLTATFSLVLARRLHKPDVSFGGITTGRSIDKANIEHVMGPCYQFTPIRVVFEPQWSAMDLLRFIQRQSVESMAYDFVGFEKISKHCAKWSSGAKFFDSIVHHQDFEDFDSMPFANGKCRVEILNPHGDASYPLKVVSFSQRGIFNIGVVGSEADEGFINSLLDELVMTVKGLVDSAPGSALLQLY
ncbi:nonribosomal peptide synthase [Trichoderma arundinaceum]|uniref:Nonribosomal peptide synthase n=1 Tax=Trichoderma arundinaceum TaxID=490622 RepID=A0A395NZ87_TRIAR|nr:nonribosomal peptide synthase [Trichoderma arundinaceum]